MNSDFHDTPFDEGTLLKLDILSKYFESWLPVFMNNSSTRKINVFDFQCGPGTDKNGRHGSPLVIAKTIAAAKHPQGRVCAPINVYFNDKIHTKVNKLKEMLDSENSVERVTYNFSALDFSECFDNCIRHMKGSGVANFLFIDPTGLVNMEPLLRELAALTCTDFLMFVPVQYLCRFGNQEEFQKYIPGIQCNCSVEDMPKVVCSYMQEKLLAKGSDYFLAHFSIRKTESPNVHSLIFGSQSTLGLDKFLNVTFGVSPNGAANFELTGDMLFDEQALLPGIKDVSTRQQQFQRDLEMKIRKKELKTARDVALYSYRRAFLPTKHAKPILSDLKKKGLIEKVPALGYDSVFRNGQNTPLIFRE